MPQSIQDLLTSKGYTINETQLRYERDSEHIPIAETIGHTVDSFTAKAMRKGWLKPEETVWCIDPSHLITVETPPITYKPRRMFKVIFKKEEI